MVMRVGGLASGMDIDALVEKLMNAEKLPLNKLQQKKQTYEWQRDAYRDVNTKLKTFDTYVADNMVLKNISSKTASSTNSDLVSAIATGKAAGTLSIEGVSQLASSARAVSDRQIPATGSTKLSDLEISEESISIRAIQADGTLAPKATKIAIEQDMTIDQFINKINSSGAGVSAIFESGKLSITAKNTGDNKAGAEVIVDSGASVFGKLGFSNLEGVTSGNLASGGTNAIFEVNGISTERSTNNFTLNGYNVTLKNKFNESTTTFMTKYTTALTEQMSANKAIEVLTTAKNNAVGAYNTKQVEFQDNFNLLSLDKQAAYTTINNNSFLKGLTTEEVTELSAFTFSPPTNPDDMNEINAAIDASSGLSDTLKEKLKSATFTVDQLSVLSNLDETDLTTFKELGTKEVEMNIASNSKLMAENKLTEGQTRLDNANAVMASIKTEAQGLGFWDDAKDQLNTNAVNASKSVAPITLSSTTNVDAMMDKIKEFVATYNGVIKDFSEQTKQTKYRDYAPLTDEQRKEMSESEVKLWEEKAKSGLLRNDSLVRTGLSNMRALVYEANPGLSDSKYNTLYSVGITTTKNYNDGGQLEIDENKLRAAIEADPDAVDRLFKNTEGKKDAVVDGKTADTRGYIEKLRESMKNFEISIENKAGRSTMTEQQYTIGKNLVDTDKRIDSWKTKLQMIEERYWKQFNAMESAINKSNSQSAMLFPQTQ